MFLAIEHYITVFEKSSNLSSCGGPELWQFISQKNFKTKTNKKWTDFFFIKKAFCTQNYIEHLWVANSSFSLESDEKKSKIINVVMNKKSLARKKYTHG